jgi:dipeptidyl aminopeptidase/acylaminoacyl peptidase
VLLLTSILTSTVSMSIPTKGATGTDLRALTVDDLVMMERVSDPRLSPDGRFVAYTLRQTDLAANKGIKSLWLIDLGETEGAPRKLSGGNGNSESGRWAPDGKSLYFLSSRSGSSQVWRLPLSGGEAQAVTSYPLDVNAFALSPDGCHLAISMEVFADCATLDCSKKKLDEQAARLNKGSGQLYDQLFMRHWDTWKNGRRAQLFVARLGEDGSASAEPVHISKGIAGDVPSKPFGGDEEFSFSPDGKTLVFCARIADKTEAWSTNFDLYRVPVDGSRPPENLTAGRLATDTGPVFSPDGRTLAWRAMKRPGFEADRYGIWLMDLASSAKRELAPDWDHSAETLAFSAQGSVLYTTAEVAGQKPLFAIDTATGAVQRMTEQGTVSGFTVGDDCLVFALNTLTGPDQLFKKPRGKSPATRITRHNGERLAQIGFTGFEQFSFAGWNNEIVHGYVHKPFGYQKGGKYPVAFLIHGGPQGSFGNDWHYRWNPQLYAGMGYAVVAIDFHGSTGYGQKFTDSISGDWGGKPLEDLQKGWAFAQEKYEWLDGKRAAALGASYGGYMVNWIAGNWPDAFRCLVNHDGTFDNRTMSYSTEELWFDEWEHGGTQFEKPDAFEKHNPVNYVAKWKTPMLVIHGGLDFRIPYEQGVAAFTALQRRGIPSQFLYFPDENHWVLKPQNSVQWHQTVRAWLDRWTTA